MSKAAIGYALAPSRVQFQNKDPRGWKEFADQLAGNSTKGSALTMRGVQKRRPSLFDLVERMKTITAPTLVMTGDEDWPCLEPALLMKRMIPTAGLVVLPNTVTRSTWRSRPYSTSTYRIFCTRPSWDDGRYAIRGRWLPRSWASSAGRTQQQIYSAAFKPG